MRARRVLAFAGCVWGGESQVLPHARPGWDTAGAGGPSPSVGGALGAGAGKGSSVPGEGPAAPAGGPARPADLACRPVPPPHPFVPFLSTGAARRKKLGKPRW